MNVFLDTNALVKRYIRYEEGSPELLNLWDRADVIGVAAITHTEFTATAAKSVRMNILTNSQAEEVLRAFQADWGSLFRLEITAIVIAHASRLAWDLSLRGYDAVQLASAIQWQQMLSQPVVFTTYDKQLWNAANILGLECFPVSL